MKYRIDLKLGDGKAEAPPLEFDLAEITLIEAIEEELTNDAGREIHPASITIERVE